MENDLEKRCRICNGTIPPARLAALPDTLVCLACSERTGGESELKVTVSGTGKAGSLKITGQSVHVTKQRKPLR